jgi:hypothetical protein
MYGKANILLLKAETPLRVRSSNELEYITHKEIYTVYPIINDFPLMDCYAVGYGRMISG